MGVANLYFMVYKYDLTLPNASFILKPLFWHFIFLKTMYLTLETIAIFNRDNLLRKKNKWHCRRSVVKLQKIMWNLLLNDFCYFRKKIYLGLQTFKNWTISICAIMWLKKCTAIYSFILYYMNSIWNLIMH